jgi:hypothetical protein
VKSGGSCVVLCVLKFIYMPLFIFFKNIVKYMDMFLWIGVFWYKVHISFGISIYNLSF